MPPQESDVPDESAPAGWFDDPHGIADLRYWDGTSWTEHTHDRSPSAAVPTPAAATPPADNSESKGPNWGVLIGLLLLIVVAIVGITAFTGGDSDLESSGTRQDSGDSTAESVEGSAGGSDSPFGSSSEDSNGPSSEPSAGFDGAQVVKITSVELTNSDFQLDGGEIVVADGLVWVTSPGAVGVLDESTGELVDSIPVESTEAAQLSAGGGRVWLAQPFTNSLTVIDTASRAVVGEVVLPSDTYRTSGPAMLMDGYAWVASWSTAVSQVEKPDLVTVIDTETLSVVARIEVGQGAGSLTLVDGTVWLVSSLANEVSAIDVASLSVVATISAGDFPNDLAYSGGAIWVANSRGATVSVIDPSTSAVIDEIAVGTAMSDADQQMPGPRAIYARGGSIWITLTQDNSLKVIDTTSREVVESIPTNGQPLGFSDAVVWAPGGVSVVVIDQSTYEIVDELTVGDGGGLVYDLAATADAVWVVSDNSTVTKIATGR